MAEEKIEEKTFTWPEYVDFIFEKREDGTDRAPRGAIYEGYANERKEAYLPAMQEAGGITLTFDGKERIGTEITYEQWEKKETEVFGIPYLKQISKKKRNFVSIDQETGEIRKLKKARTRKEKKKLTEILTSDYEQGKNLETITDEQGKKYYFIDIDEEDKKGRGITYLLPAKNYKPNKKTKKRRKQALTQKQQRQRREGKEEHQQRKNYETPTGNPHNPSEKEKKFEQEMRRYLGNISGLVEEARKKEIRNLEPLQQQNFKEATIFLSVISSMGKEQTLPLQGGAQGQFYVITNKQGTRTYPKGLTDQLKHATKTLTEKEEIEELVRQTGEGIREELTEYIKVLVEKEETADSITGTTPNTKKEKDDKEENTNTNKKE